MGPRYGMDMVGTHDADFTQKIKYRIRCGYIVYFEVYLCIIVDADDAPHLEMGAVFKEFILFHLTVCLVYDALFGFENSEICPQLFGYLDPLDARSQLGYVRLPKVATLIVSKNPENSCWWLLRILKFQCSTLEIEIVRILQVKNDI